MTKQANRKNAVNFIKNTEKNARELFGYDDETLLLEFKEAEQELLRRKENDSELEETLAKEADAGFDAIMARIRAEGIKPVTEAEYAEKKNEAERNVVSLKPMIKVLFVAAAVMVLLMGMGGGVSARNVLEYTKIMVGNEKNIIIWSAGDIRQDLGTVEDAYTKVHEELGIDVLKLKYKCKELQFAELIVDRGHALFVFAHENERLFLREGRYPVEGVSDGVVSDRKEVESVYNALLNQTLIIEENIIEGELSEYNTKLSIEGAYYYFSGNVKKEEFVKMVQFLTFD